MRRINLFLAALACSWACSSPAWAATKRALLIGIDLYEPPPTAAVNPAQAGRAKFGNLDGAVNDAESLGQILISKYGFKPENIVLLKNEEANRQAILDTFNRHLVAPAAPGDTSVFYYAGHGSQVMNSQTKELDKKDESIVPADSYKGVQDIRDKEVAQLFNGAIDKGVTLTAIFDSCHSGSVGRGVPRQEKSRYLEPDTRDIADPAEAPTAPETRPQGALIFSATQDRDLAYEAVEVIQHGGKTSEISHGAFTLALLRVLRAVPQDEPASRIFQRIEATLDRQAPVIAGAPERLAMPLFPDDPGAPAQADNQVTLAVHSVQPDEKTVTLQGGLALGLRPGCRLRKLQADPKARPTYLEITQVNGLSQSQAVLLESVTLKGQAVEAETNLATIHRSDLFEVDLWMLANETQLQAWVPPALAPSALPLVQMALAQIKRLPQVTWVSDPTEETPTHILFWNGTDWQLTGTGSTLATLGATLEPGQVAALLPAAPQPVRLFANLPPAPGLAAALQQDFSSPTSPVKISAVQAGADYYLMGRALEPGADALLEYAWIRPDASAQDSQGKSAALPVRTDWLSQGPPQETSLKDYLVRLSKIKGWMTLDSAPDDGQFPYRLALRNVQTGEITAAVGSRLQENESYSMVLLADQAKLERLGKGVQRRYVYVFVIDKDGNSVLLFPGKGQGNAENYMPIMPDGQNVYPAELPVGRAKFKIRPPLGTDTYIMLSSIEKIPSEHLGAFNFKGVTQETQVKKRGLLMPLANLIYDIGGSSRAAEPYPQEESMGWAIERLPLQSVPVGN